MKKLFYNGQVITADKANSVHQAVMVEDGKIVFVGSTHKSLRYIDDETETIDLCGCAILPGFIDCHIHMAVAEAQSGKEIQLDGENGAKTAAELLTKIENAAKDTVQGEWIVGSSYTHEQ